MKGNTSGAGASYTTTATTHIDATVSYGGSALLLAKIGDTITMSAWGNPGYYHAYSVLYKIS